MYKWTAQPNEEDPDHTHSFETHLKIIEGEIEIRMDGVGTILKPGDEIVIPKGKTHYGKAGPTGCVYWIMEGVK